MGEAASATQLPLHTSPLPPSSQLWQEAAGTSSDRIHTDPELKAKPLPAFGSLRSKCWLSGTRAGSVPRVLPTFRLLQNPRKSFWCPLFLRGPGASPGPTSAQPGPVLTAPLSVSWSDQVASHHMPSSWKPLTRVQKLLGQHQFIQ